MAISNCLPVRRKTTPPAETSRLTFSRLPWLELAIGDLGAEEVPGRIFLWIFIRMPVFNS